MGRRPKYCSLVARPCPKVCSPMDWSTPGFLVLLHLWEFAQTQVHWAIDAIQPSHPVMTFSSPQSFPTSGTFPMSPLFTQGGQSIGASLSASVLPVNMQGWFPLRLTGLILAVQGTLKSLLQHHILKRSILQCKAFFKEKAMAAYSSTLAWKIPWTEESGWLQSMGSLGVGHDWVASILLFTLMH